MKSKPIVTRIVVNLERQVLLAYENNREVYEFHCVTGDKDHPTPRGNFRVYRKHRKYRSKKYNVQMDYAMFFYKGYAIHMAYFVGVMSFLKWGGIHYFGSHGCVRLAELNARELFDHTPYRTHVKIV